MKFKMLSKPLLFITIVFSLIGCSSDGDDNNVENNEISRELLIGTWSINEADMILNDDGTGESEVLLANSQNFEFRPLTWRLDAEILTINFSVGTSVFQIIEINEKNMTLQDVNGVRREYLRK